MPSKQHTPFSGEVDPQLEQFLDAFYSGNPAGLLELVDYCSEHNLPLPKWASHKINKIVSSYFLGAKGAGKGRHAKLLTEYREQLANRVRIQAYLGTRHWQRDPTRYDYLPSMILRKWFNGTIKHGNPHKNWARDHVSEALRGTAFFCTSNRLKKIVESQKSFEDADFKPAGARTTQIEILDNPMPDFSAHNWKWEKVLFGKEFEDIFSPPYGPPVEHTAKYLNEWPLNS